MKENIIYIEDENIQEIVKRWEKYGFLQGLNDEKLKKRCALAFEMAAQRYLDKSNYPSHICAYDEIIENAIFPFIRKLYDEGYNPSPFNGIDYFKFERLFRENYKMIKDAFNGTEYSIDIEAEAIYFTFLKYTKGIDEYIDAINRATHNFPNVTFIYSK